MNKKIHEIMTAHTRCVAPETSVMEAARIMRDLDVGSLPICDHDRLAGIVTDRDLTVRGMAEARDPGRTTVRDVMTPGIAYVYDDEDAQRAARIMEERQIRRLAVLNRAKRLVGIVSLGDIAVRASAVISGDALQGVSESPVPLRQPPEVHGP
jgi:CBS domain-containing protein